MTDRRRTTRAGGQPSYLPAVGPPHHQRQPSLSAVSTDVHRVGRVHRRAAASTANPAMVRGHRTIARPSDRGPAEAFGRPTGRQATPQPAVGRPSDQRPHGHSIGGPVSRQVRDARPTGDRPTTTGHTTTSRPPTVRPSRRRPPTDDHRPVDRRPADHQPPTVRPSRRRPTTTDRSTEDQPTIDLLAADHSTTSRLPTRQSGDWARATPRLADRRTAEQRTGEADNGRAAGGADR